MPDALAEETFLIQTGEAPHPCPGELLERILDQYRGYLNLILVLEYSANGIPTIKIAKGSSLDDVRMSLEKIAHDNGVRIEAQIKIAG